MKDRHSSCAVPIATRELNVCAPSAEPVYPVTRRPFYTEYAWAFDLLIDRPVRKECGVIADWLFQRGVLPGAELLDAGCGTGRYTRELRRRGYVIQGIDLSPELIDVAKGLGDDRSSSSLFAIGNILALPAARYDAILCR